MQRRRRARADFFGDREQRERIDRRQPAGLAHRLAGRQQGRDRGLVVEIAGVDVAAGLDLELRIEGDPVADVDAGGDQVLRRSGLDVHADLDVFPAHRLGVDLVTEGVAGSLQRQAGAPQLAVVGVDRQPPAFSEACRPVADRHDAETAVGLDLADHRAEGVEVGDDRSRGAAFTALDGCANGPAAGHLVRYAEGFESAGGVADDRVGQADRTRNRQQLHQRFLQKRIVDRGQCSRRVHARLRCCSGPDGSSTPGRGCIEPDGVGPPLLQIPSRSPAENGQGSTRERGNSRSTKRSAVGCGS